MNTVQSRRALLAGAPVAAAAALAGTTVALAIPRTADVDPIFDVIAEHQAAAEEYTRAVMVSGAMAAMDRTKIPDTTLPTPQPTTLRTGSKMRFGTF